MRNTSVTRATSIFGTSLAAALLLGGCSSDAPSAKHTWESSHHASSSGHSSGSGQSSSTPSNHSSQSSQSQGSGETESSSVPQADSPGDPVSMTATTMGVIDHSVQGFGLNKDGTISPPPGVIQWYNQSPSVRPGEVGNAIIAGHVTYDGPDVFANLKKVKSGDVVEIATSKSKILKFKVTRTASVDKNALMKDPTVWGSTKDRNLVLISCDAGSGWVDAHHHSNNLVAWAKLVG